jgi:hypothetical protein
MFARILSQILIAAVIACPLSCYSGMCLSDACLSDACLSDACLSDACLSDACLSGASGATHGNSSQNASNHCSSCQNTTTPESGSKHVPDRCPMQSCQGVCGGAVFERPIEIELLDGAFCLPFGDTPSFAVAGLTVESMSPCEAETPWCFGDSNVGRSLCINHMSFQC